MKSLLSIFGELSAGFAAAIASAVTALSLIVLFSLYNGLWENPRLIKNATKTARDGYVAMSKLEAAKAKAQLADDLLKLSEAKQNELQEKLSGYDEAGHKLKQSLARKAATKELKDELQALENNRKLAADDIPSLDDLGILNQLHQR